MVDSALDRALYRRVSLILLIGLLVSGAVMVAGLIAVGVTGGEPCVLPLDQVFSHLGHGGGSCSAGGAAKDHKGGTGTAILDAGILLLFATPLAGVLVAAAGFAQERDWVFAGVTVLLLCMLAMAVVVALH